MNTTNVSLGSTPATTNCYNSRACTFAWHTTSRMHPSTPPYVYEYDDGWTAVPSHTWIIGE